jgi:hypothetical protein
LTGSVEAVVGVNHNTMFRALRHLRDEGLWNSNVDGASRCQTMPLGLTELVARCRELLGFLSCIGYCKEELLKIIEALP